MSAGESTAAPGRTPLTADRDPYVGCLLGTAVGDALGLPYEGMSARRGARMFPNPGRYHLLPGYGMVSDDTEHACFVARALVRSRGRVDAFERQLAASLRWWLLGLPAGVGLATLKSVSRLWLGFPPSRSGVLSAGNGPAMRGPILGVAFGASPATLQSYVERSTRLTHTDPRAYQGALTVAVAAARSAAGESVSPSGFVASLDPYLEGETAAEFRELIGKAVASAEKGETVSEFAYMLGGRNGISGYVGHTVPCVVQTWLRHQEGFASGLREIIAAGGDTDTTAAILGAIVGARVGKGGIPDAWLRGIIEWPRSVAWMERLGQAARRAVEDEADVPSPAYFVPGILARNACFLAVVLAHGFRRLLPPY